MGGRWSGLGGLMAYLRMTTDEHVKRDIVGDGGSRRGGRWSGLEGLIASPVHSFRQAHQQGRCAQGARRGRGVHG